MRPFRFFFGLSLAIALFLFLARFLVFAFVAAIVLSTVFFLVKKAKRFFQRLNWDAELDDYAFSRYRNNALDPYYQHQSWPPSRLAARRVPAEDWLTDYRTVKVQ